MAKLVFLGVPAHGHVNPSLAVVGEIIERGRHNDLLEQQGAYYGLYMSQFREEDVPASSNGREAVEFEPSGD